MWEQLGRNRRQPLDERLQVGDGSQVVREEIAGFFSQRLGNGYEILDVQPALATLQSREMRRRHRNSLRDMGLTAAFGLAKLPEDATVHTPYVLHVRSQRDKIGSGNCHLGKTARTDRTSQA